MYMYLSFKKSWLSAPKVTAFNQQKSYALVICMHRFLFMLVELWDCCSSPVLPVFPLGKIPKHLEQGHTSVFSCLFVCFSFFLRSYKYVTSGAEGVLYNISSE